MVDRLAGKIAIVTGAGRGIGEAIARAFAREGAAVVIAERDAATGEATAAALRADGAKARFIQTDVTDEASVGALHRDDARPNMAASTSSSTMQGSMCSTRRWRPAKRNGAAVSRSISTGSGASSKAALPAMIASGGGAIVNIASCHGFSIIPGCFPYPVAKHGIIGVTRALGVEFAARNIRVNAIAPGYIETQLAIDYWATFADPEAERRRTYDMHPPKRIGRPEEVAMTAVFLASDEAPFINAATIVIDGGRSVLYHE